MSVASALLLVASYGAIPVARGQTPSAVAVATPDSAIVVLIPAEDGAVSPSRVARAVGNRDVTAVYTTNAPAARRFAKRLHDRLGGSLIPYDRVGMAADEFAGVLVENAVDYAAHRNLGRAVLVVVEPDLTRSFLRYAAGSAAPGVADVDSRVTDGFVITVAPDGSRAVVRISF